jgi:hypothetical protein
MKKTIFLLAMLATLLIAGCNEKKLINQIDGTWHIQKYAVGGVDQTRMFDTTHAAFTWNFSGGKSFYQTWTSIQLNTVYNNDSVAHYDTATHTFVVDSVITSKAIVPTTYSNYVSGDWYLINGNQWIETRDSVYGDKSYQIIDHSNNSLHLLYGNIDYYLSN